MPCSASFATSARQRRGRRRDREKLENSFEAGRSFQLGDVAITPFTHSARCSRARRLHVTFGSLASDRTGYRSGYMPESVNHHQRRLRRLDVSNRIRPGDAAASVRIRWAVKQRVLSPRVGHLSNPPLAEFFNRRFDGAGLWVLRTSPSRTSPRDSRACGRECARHPAAPALRAASSCWASQVLAPLPRTHAIIQSSNFSGRDCVPYSMSRRSAQPRCSATILSSWRYDILRALPRDARDYGGPPCRMQSSSHPARRSPAPSISADPDAPPSLPGFFALAFVALWNLTAHAGHPGRHRIAASPCRYFVVAGGRAGHSLAGCTGALPCRERHGARPAGPEGIRDRIPEPISSRFR